MSTITDAPAAPARQPVEVPSKRITPQQLEALAARVISTSGNDPMEIEQPFTGKPLGTVPKCSPDDVRAAIERAREAQAAWAKTSFAERRIFLRYHDLVLDKQDELLDLLQIESGKARRHAFEEVLDVAIIVALLREHRREAPQAAPPPGRAAAADRGVGVPPPARRGRDHRALELPAHAVDQRRARRRSRPATAWC